MKSRFACLIVLVMLIGCAPNVIPCGPEEGFGRFDSDVAEVQLLKDGRNAILLKSFSYTDSRNDHWQAPAGEPIDGASIPQVFWSVIGGPYEGKYRFASIVHDRYCRVHDGKKWEDVHWMFYEACRAGGTKKELAKLMYAAVYHFGPRWKEGEKSAAELAELIPPERARIASELKKRRGMSADAPAGRAPADEYLDAVLAPRVPSSLEADPVSSPVIAKWDRIRAMVRNNPDIDPSKLKDVP